MNQTKIETLAKLLAEYHAANHHLACAHVNEVRADGGAVAHAAKWSRAREEARKAWLDGIFNVRPSVEELAEVVRASGRPCRDPVAKAEELLRGIVGVECKSMLVRVRDGYKLRVQTPRGGFVEVDAESRNLLVVATLRRHNQRAEARTGTSTWPRAIESKSTIFCTPAHLRALGELGRIVRAPRAVEDTMPATPALVSRLDLMARYIPYAELGGGRVQFKVRADAPAGLPRFVTVDEDGSWIGCERKTNDAPVVARGRLLRAS